MCWSVSERLKEDKIMVKVTEYHPGEFMVNTTKSEALRLIKSLAAQLYNDNCNRDRVEFRKRHKDDVTYFSIAVDESKSVFYVMTNVINNDPINDVIVNTFDTSKEARDFMVEFDGKGMISKDSMWMKEVMR
jgi:hypothetical protein